MKFFPYQLIMNRATGSNAGLDLITTNSGSWGATGGYISLRPNDVEAMRVLVNGNVGIGNTGAANYHVYATKTHTEASAAELGFVGTFNTASQTGYGIIGEAATNGSANITNLTGSYNTVRVAGSSAITVATAIGNFGRIRKDNSSGASITNAYLLSGAVEGSGTMTIGTLYGLYLPDLTQGSTNYSIYTGLGNASFGDDVILRNDSDKLIFGAGQDATISYDGTNMIINPKAVGTGYLSVTGAINAAANDIYTTGAVKGVHKAADGTAAVADGTYTVGKGSVTDGTITIKDGIITAVQQASNI
jgi:hypothetical protein